MFFSFFSSRFIDEGKNKGRNHPRGRRSARSQRREKRVYRLLLGPTADSMEAPEGYMTSPEYIANTVDFNGYIYADTDKDHLWPLSKNETVEKDFIKSDNVFWAV